MGMGSDRGLLRRIDSRRGALGTGQAAKNSLDALGNHRRAVPLGCFICPKFGVQRDVDPWSQDCSSNPTSPRAQTPGAGFRIWLAGRGSD